MLEQNLFYRFRQLIGGFRNDVAPVVADGDPATARFNADSELFVTIGSIAPGVLQVEGTQADGATPPTANPVQIGAVSDDVLAAVADNIVVHFVTDLYRRLRTIPEGKYADGAADTVPLNPLKMGAVVDAVLSALADGQTAQLITDTFRRLYVNPQGGVADGAADDSSNPVKLGAVAIQVPTSVDSGDRAQLTTDLERFLRIVSKAYDSVAAADRVSSNTIADDRDESAQVWAAETNTGAGTSYYPSSSGYEVGNRDHLTFAVVNTDCTLTIQASNDATTWIDITPSVMDLTSGTTLAASFPTGVGLSANWILDLERINARYVRCAVVYLDAGNATSIKVMARKA
jgi:hypothetical protein